MSYKDIILYAFIVLSAGYSPVIFAMELKKKQEQNKQQALTNLFFDACKKGLDKNVAHFIQLGVDINARDEKNNTPLHYATENGHLSTIEILVKNGASIENKINSKANQMIASGLSSCPVPLSPTSSKKNQELMIQTKPFLDACVYGDIKQVSYFIDQGGNVNTKDSRELTALHFACNHGQLDITRLLIENGADVKAEDYEMMTPLHHACIFGNLDIVELLINNGANVNVIDIKKRTPLHFACDKGYIKIVELLFAHKANINAKNYQNCTPLHFACQKGHFNVVEFMVDNGAIVNVQTSQKFTPLHAACQKNDNSFDIVSLLLKNGANIDAKTFTNATPLHSACCIGNIKIVELLIERGACIYAKNDKNFTPLDVARQNKHNDIVEFLIKKRTNTKPIAVRKAIPQNPFLDLGFITLCAMGRTNEVSLFIQHQKMTNVNARDPNDNKTPLHYACIKGYDDIVSLLLKHGADTEAEDNTKQTPLHYACRRNNLNIVKLLLKYKAKTEAEADLRARPLHCACHDGYYSTVEELIKNDAIIDAENINQATPLHSACACLKENNINIVKLLVEKGANIYAQDCQNLIPLHYACQKGNLNIVELFFQKGISINTETTIRVTPLHIACQNGHLNVVEFLIQNGANINAKNYQAVTPLHYAVIFGKTGIVKILLESKDIDTNAKTIHGLTALDFAYENPAIVELFAKRGVPIITEEEAEAFGQALFARLKQEEPLEIKVEIKNEAELPAKLTIFENVADTDSTSTTASTSTTSTTSITSTSGISTSINNKRPVSSKKVVTKSSPQQQSKVNKTQVKNSKSIQITNSAASKKYDVVRPKKWPRSLVHANQIDAIYNCFRQLEKWPDLEGLDYEPLQGQMKGQHCVRVGGHRIIFTVDEKNCKIYIDQIALHHNGYK